MSTAHTTPFVTLDRVEAQPPRAKEMRAGVYRGPGRVATEYVPVPEIADGEVHGVRCGCLPAGI